MFCNFTRNLGLSCLQISGCMMLTRKPGSKQFLSHTIRYFTHIGKHIVSAQKICALSRLCQYVTSPRAAVIHTKFLSYWVEAVCRLEIVWTMYDIETETLSCTRANIKLIFIFPENLSVLYSKKQSRLNKGSHIVYGEQVMGLSILYSNQNMVGSWTTITLSFVTVCLEMNDKLYLKIGSFFLVDPILYTLRLTCKWPIIQCVGYATTMRKGRKSLKGSKALFPYFLSQFPATYWFML